jgi:hypothetical protein
MKTSKTNQKRIELINSFNTETANAWERLKVVTAKTHIANLGLNKALKDYLFEAKDVLTEKQIKILAFKNVVEFISTNEKFNGVTLYSLHSIQLICNEILKQEDKNIARALRTAKQQAQTDKK